MTRRPAASAASNNAAVADEKWAPNTSAVVVPCDASARTKLARGILRVGDIRHARFFGQRHVLEPVEQRPAQRADDPQLGKVDVRVDEARVRESRRASR